MSAYRTDPANRWRAGLGAVAVQAVVGYALIAGLAVSLSPPRAAQDALALFVPETLPPPPRPVVPPPKPSTRPEGRASPPNLRAQATELVAPPPILPLHVPPPVVVAEKPYIGRADDSGAADIAGPGTGSGGIGDGFGGGGDGDGDGGGAEAETPPRFLRGRLSYADNPLRDAEGAFRGAVDVRYVVGVDGRVSNCRVTGSSGSRLLDTTTCRLIEQRFRFRPSLDARGRPVPSTIVESHSWEVEEEPPEDWRDRPRRRD